MVGAATVGVAVTAGLAGWGGSMIALAGSDTTPAAASSSTVQGRPTGTPVPSAPTAGARPTGATPTGAPPAEAAAGSVMTTPPTARPPLAPAQVAGSSSSPAGRAHVTPDEPVRAAAPPPTARSEPDIVFVSPWRDHYSGQWYYRVGLLGFPADTVVEVSGLDADGNVRVAPLAMTTANGSWDPFTAAFAVDFAFGGTCDEAEPATVTARGSGFSVTETAPRPVECDGGVTSDGPWTRPVSPPPVPVPPSDVPR